MYLECMTCNENMDILEEERGDYTVEYSQCPKCKCKVVSASGDE